MSKEDKGKLVRELSDLSGIGDVEWSKMSSKDLKKLIDRFSDGSKFTSDFLAHRAERRIERRGQKTAEVLDRVRKRIRDRPVMGPILDWLGKD